MTPEVFSWDDASDNRFLASGVGCWIHDAISAYRTTEDTNPDVFKNTHIALEPAGPGGKRVSVSAANVYMIWKFSKNQQAAKEFLVHFGEEFKEGMIQSRGYNMPYLLGDAKKPMPIIGADPKMQILQDFPPLVAFYGYPGPFTTPIQEVVNLFVLPDMFTRVARGPGGRRRDEVGRGRVPPDLLQAQERMTTASLSGGPEPRAAAVSLPVRATGRSWWQTATARRLSFGYLLLAPAALYVMLLVGAPFLFSLWLAVSDANVGEPVARFVGLENFRAAMEMDTFWIAMRNSVVFLVVAAIFKSLLGTSLAFLLLQNFRGKKLIRGLVVIPFTLPVAISVLSWKWMYDSQFSVINWVLHRLGLIGGYGSESWPVWLGQPALALMACIAVNVWRTFPFSAIVLLAGFTAVPLEVLDAAKVDGCSFFQRFRNIVVPMIFPILMIGFLFDTVFTLSDLSVVYLLTQGGPGNATKILPVLAYQIGIQAGNLGRGAAIALFLVPLLFPMLFLVLRNIKRKEW